MKYLWISIVIAGLSSAVTARSLREACGVGRVLNSTVVHTPKGHQLRITTKACESKSESHSALTGRSEFRRQANECNQDCTVSCGAVTGNAPFADDCDQVTDALEALFPQTFPAPAGTFTQFDLGHSCAVGFGNLETFDMTYCFLDLGFDLGIISAQCFPDFDSPQASSTGFCFPPSQQWGAEGFEI